MRTISFLFLFCLSCLMASCASYDFARRVVQQGNLLPAAKVEKIRPGMSKDEVAIILGSSLLSPTFDNNRWDYAYTWRKGNGSLLVKHAVIYFKGDRVSHIEHQP